MPKHTAIYCRVSSKGQDTASQEPELQTWANAQAAVCVWYEDAATGKNMNRPGWRRLEADIHSGKVAAVVVWRLDRLGRTAAGLTRLFEELQQRKVNLISLKDGLDLATAAGRLMANVLASVAQYETEVRSERQRAGIDAARAAGKRWGGSKPGTRRKVTADQIKVIHQLRCEKTPIARIARTVHLSRPTIYEVLGQGAPNGQDA